MADQPQLSGNLAATVADFIENTPPSRLSRNLRGLLLSHLAMCKDGFWFDLEDLLVDMLHLFEFLDIVGQEIEANNSDKLHE